MQLLNLNNEIIPKENCHLCQGTGIARYVDMNDVPVGTSMIMGDKTWEKYEKLDICPDCFQYPSNEKCKILYNEN